MTTQLAQTPAPVPSASLYHDAMLLSHLLRSVRSDACRQVSPPDCNATRESLEFFSDDATWAQIGELYRKVARAIGRDDLAIKQLEVVSPATAWEIGWELVGVIMTDKDGRHYLTAPEAATPIVLSHLKTGAGPSRVRWLLGGLLIGSAAVGLGWWLIAQR